MADTWNEKLRTFRLDAETAALRGGSDMPLDRLMTEAAAALDRTEALEQALKIIAECPPECVHLMPLAAQAALSGGDPK